MTRVTYTMFNISAGRKLFSLACGGVDLWRGDGEVKISPGSHSSPDAAERLLSEF